jgi:hypothetical protein
LDACGLKVIALRKIAHKTTAFQLVRNDLASTKHAHRARGHRSSITVEEREAVRAASSIQDTVAEYVRLRRTGSNFVGLCPFHCEKTPSFCVNPARGRAHCFGCGWDVDIFSFVQQIKNLTFRQTVKYLAERLEINLNNQTTPEETSRAGSEQEGLEHATRALAEAESAALREMRENLHQLLALQRNAGARLDTVDNGARLRWLGEPEWVWEALRVVADELPRADAAYCIAAFAAPAERYAFALYPERRAEMTEAALERGYMADARGYRFQVAI